ncbi:MlaD family protein [Nocardia sp. NPDC047648]|uniref:MlaD family protein n=1 Tax=Nocardia sp. NPDC047648 TaxID=3155625 RepID=UPI0033DE9FA6
MLLSRLVRAQLLIFAVLSVVGLTTMATVYMRLPSLAGVGTISVSMELPTTGGLYRFGNVTYRGVEVGEVSSVELTGDGVRATLKIDSSHHIPADLTAEVRSVSAVGEQYVELRPRTDSPPYLRDGSVIDLRHTTVPQPVGPMLDQLSSLVGSIPTDKLHELLDELFRGMHGARDDLDSLLTSAQTLAAELNGAGDRTRTLIDDSRPLLDSQVRSADAIRIWTRSLAGVSDQLVADDPRIRALLRSGPGFTTEVAHLLDSVKLTLPILLSDLTSIGQLGVTYNAGLEQILVLLPPAISMIQAVQPNRNASGLGLGDFRLGGISDPPACTVGFLPPSAWRSPEETDTIDTPDGLYCKLPQDSDIAVRGVRNIPCANNPAKRAPTAALCNSDEEFRPLATEQPLLGPYPRDPGLEGQGIPPDSRWSPGTPSPAAPASAPANSAGPSIGIARYDPRTGNYLGPDGRLYQQSDLASAPGRGWTDMLPH